MRMTQGFWLQRFWRDTHAATSIEYAVIAVLVAVVIVGAATSVGIQLKARITPVAAGLS